MSADEALTWIQEYRDLRETVERAILPIATSVDGRRFQYQASLHGLDLEPGGYVAIDTGEETRLGQLLSLEMETLTAAAPGRQGQIAVRAAQGEGALLDGGGRPFHDGRVRRAAPADVGAWRERSRSAGAALSVGELALAPGVPFELDARGFGRHTFLCGQSGSGKTYSLGLVLEQLLLGTSLRMVILDPNSDYIRLSEVRDSADPAVVAEYAATATGVSVWQNDPGVAHHRY